MLQKLEAFQINKVLRSNFSIWSPGLSRQNYLNYQWWQFNSTWGRRNLQYFGHFNGSGRLLASCKLYNLEFMRRGKLLKTAGIGAVYVEESARGSGHGLAMLQEIIELCKKAGYDAVFLNSDIDPNYYARLGFKLFDYQNFVIELNSKTAEKLISSLEDPGINENKHDFIISAPLDQSVEQMCKHHLRWRSRDRAYYLMRSPDYWRFKLEREQYLSQNSRLNWPKMEIISCGLAEFDGGYCLLEQSGKYLRVLETAGSENSRNKLWTQILMLSINRGIKEIRGWKLSAPPCRHGVKLLKRNWSLPMLLALNKQAEAEIRLWQELEPGNFLELDHF